MATITTQPWAEGDLIDAVDLQKISDDLNAIHAESGDVLRQSGSRQTYTTEASGQQIVKGHSLRHFFRYLIYSGTGTIEDPAGLGDDVSLSDSGTDTGIYDLDSVSWLYRGKFYRAEGDGLLWCREVTPDLV
jgi:hypothetical protein